MARGITRPSSVLSQSDAREIIKRREKPYQIEPPNRRSKGLPKQRRLYRGKPPAGFVYVPLGTPDLADLCKRLSEERGEDVQVVNAAASGNPAAKISNQLRRIGYHFRDQVVEDACAELGYTILDDEFVKEDTMTKRHNDNKIARILERHGYQTKVESEETPEKVGAVIREIFPAIPQADLDEIVNRAWEPGTGRVGAGDIDLPQKAQLAVTARIRHKYTDYDYLLKSFDWSVCRKMVEHDCIKKLIEWRGENGDDSMLEDIVRETIVIDDDSATEVKTKRRKTLDNDTDTGNATDISLEITHRPAGADDLREEKPEELEHPYFKAKQRPVRRAKAAARKKIEEAVRAGMQQQEQSRLRRQERSQLQQSDESPRYQPDQSQRQVYQPQLHQPDLSHQPERIWIDPGRDGAGPNEIVINGVRMIKAPSGGNSEQTAPPTGQVRNFSKHAAPYYNNAPLPATFSTQMQHQPANTHSAPLQMQRVQEIPMPASTQPVYTREAAMPSSQQMANPQASYLQAQYPLQTPAVPSQIQQAFNYAQQQTNYQMSRPKHGQPSNLQIIPSQIQTSAQRPGQLNYIRLEPLPAQYGQSQTTFSNPMPAQTANHYDQRYQVIPRPLHGSPAAVQHIPYAQLQPSPQGQYQYPR